MLQSRQLAACYPRYFGDDFGNIPSETMVSDILSFQCSVPCRTQALASEMPQCSRACSRKAVVSRAEFVV